MWTRRSGPCSRRARRGRSRRIAPRPRPRRGRAEGNICRNICVRLCATARKHVYQKSLRCVHDTLELLSRQFGILRSSARGSCRAVRRARECLRPRGRSPPYTRPAARTAAAAMYCVHWPERIVVRVTLSRFTASLWGGKNRAACCGIDLCHKHILYSVFCIFVDSCPRERSLSRGSLDAQCRASSAPLRDLLDAPTALAAILRV